MTNYIQKIIKDRNGNEKIIKVAVAGDGVLSKNPEWRGLEFGWNADDVAPESNAAARRQGMQDWVESHHGEVQARQVKMNKSYVPLIYTLDDYLAVVVFGNKSAPDIQGWLSKSGINKNTIILHRVFFDGRGRRHTLSLMS